MSSSAYEAASSRDQLVNRGSFVKLVPLLLVSYTGMPKEQARIGSAPPERRCKDCGISAIGGALFRRMAVRCRRHRRVRSSQRRGSVPVRGRPIHHRCGDHGIQSCCGRNRRSGSTAPPVDSLRCACHRPTSKCDKRGIPPQAPAVPLAQQYALLTRRFSSAHAHGLLLSIARNLARPSGGTTNPRGEFSRPFQCTPLLLPPFGANPEPP